MRPRTRPTSWQNKDWFYQMRARGICWICRQSMDENDPKLSHRECARRQRAGEKVAAIRAEKAK